MVINNTTKYDEIWNFTKFVVDRKGNVVARFEPTEKMENEILLQTKKIIKKGSQNGE